MFAVHPFPPVIDDKCTKLILGSFPSVKSREAQFYYGHPQNRFWRVLAGLFHCDVPASVEEKKACLLSRRLAVWDVLKSCEIEGSADASIKNPVINDISGIMQSYGIQDLYFNGKAAQKIFLRYAPEEIRGLGTVLPSTSPANAQYSFERLLEAWHKLLEI